MKNSYRGVVLGFLLSFLLGCHYSTPDSFFGFGRSDQRLGQVVSNAIAANPELARMPIKVAVNQGVVTLNGYVRTIRQSDKAGDIAIRVNGVRLVENNLVVRKY